MRAPTEVDEALAVAVGADHAVASDLGVVDALDDVLLVRLVGEQRQALVDPALRTDKGLVLGDDLPHTGVDPF